MSLSAASIQAPAVEATHNALRAMRDGLMDAVNKSDIDQELTYLTTNVVITWHNAEVSRGREGVRDYYNRMLNGPNKVVADFHAEVNVDELTILYGENTGIAFGSSVEHFKLTNGRSFDLKGRWTATMVKEDGRWLVAGLHVSTNIFDNVMLDMAKIIRDLRGLRRFGQWSGILGWCNRPQAQGGRLETRDGIFGQITIH